MKYLYLTDILGICGGILEGVLDSVVYLESLSIQSFLFVCLMMIISKTQYSCTWSYDSSHIDRLVPERHNTSALAMELRRYVSLHFRSTINMRNSKLAIIVRADIPSVSVSLKDFEYCFGHQITFFNMADQSPFSIYLLKLSQLEAKSWSQPSNLLQTGFLSCAQVSGLGEILTWNSS